MKNVFVLNWRCKVYMILQRQGREENRETYFFPPSSAWWNWRGLSATVGLIASPLSHPAGLACNEMKAFGWNDLSHPPRSHLPPPPPVPTRERGACGRLGGCLTSRKAKALGKLLFNRWGNFNQCRITPLDSIKGKQLEVGTRIPLETSAWRRASGVSGEITCFFFFCFFVCLFSSFRLSTLLSEI